MPADDRSPPARRHDEEIARLAERGKQGTPPVPAATVIPIRTRSDGEAGLEVLMLRRNSKIAFGGMWVFPGGRVDAEDRMRVTPGEEADRDPDLAVARQAAVREAAEEAGFQLAPDALVPYSHWTPPPITPRRFLTWFFIAAAPSARVQVDGGEIRAHEWMPPARALELRDRGEIEIAPPTWVTLFELARFASVESALQTIRARRPERFQTQIALGPHGPAALWHGDAGWETRDLDAPGGRHRLSMNQGGVWVYERTESV